MVVDQIGVEGLQVTGEVGDAAAGNEGVDLHAAVQAIVKLPGVAADGDSGDGASGGGDGTGTSEGSKPDHDFVLVAACGGAAGEHVVGDISDDIGAGVRPGPGGLVGADGRELLGRGLVVVDLREGLDAARAAGPAPGSVPLDGSATERVDARALATSARGLAPEVGVQDVRTGGLRVPLTVEGIG